MEDTLFNRRQVLTGSVIAALKERTMKRGVLLPLAMMSVLVGGLLLRPERAAADPAINSIQPVRMLDANGKQVGDPVGSTQLVRDDTGLSFVMTTSKLTPLYTYTVWWVLFKGDTVVFVSNASGGVALPDGTCSFAGHLPAGPLPKVNGKTVMVSAAGATLDNPRQVHVVFVVREHGPILLDKLADQLTTFGGGCPPNTCQDLQASDHNP